jgi:hypothetical protein
VGDRLGGETLAEERQDGELPFGQAGRTDAVASPSRYVEEDPVLADQRGQRR